MANTFIFDLDGTLIDSKIDIVNSFNLAVKKILNPQVLKDPSLYIGYSVQDMLLKLYPEILLENLKETIAEFRHIYDNSGFPNTKLYPYSMEILNDLKYNGLKMFILTNKPSTATLQILQKLEILDYFESIVTKDKDPKGNKSKSELLGDLMAEYKLGFKETLLIGDSEVDIKAAKDNMIPVAVLKHGYGNYSEIYKMKPDYIFENLKGIVKIIQYE